MDRRLEQAYGSAPPRSARDPISELVLTILSQNTSDRNSLAAFGSLSRAFPTWERVAAAPVAEVEAAIRIGGLFALKAVRIQTVLRQIARQEGTLSLESLRKASTNEVSTYLCSLPGVGLKTAACVALFALGKAAFPVDTHVLRVARRVGLIPERAGAAEAHRQLAEAVPPDRRYAFHVHLIEHGRAVCRAPRPRCPACPVTDLCDYFQRQEPGPLPAPARRAAPSRR